MRYILKNSYPSGKAVRVTEYGAFVNILPGKDGLLHVSEMDVNGERWLCSIGGQKAVIEGSESEYTKNEPSLSAPPEAE